MYTFLLTIFPILRKEKRPLRFSNSVCRDWASRQDRALYSSIVSKIFTICRNSSVNEQYEHLTLLCVLVVGSSQCLQYNSIDGINTRTLGEHFRLTSSQNVGQKRPPDASSISTLGLQCLSDPWSGPKDLTMGPPRTLCSTNTPRVRLNLEIVLTSDPFNSLAWSLLRTLHGLSVSPKTIYFSNIRLRLH